MDSRSPRDPTERDDDLRRLRTLTLSAGLAAGMAAAAFGVISAVSNPGHAAGSTVSDAAAGSQTSQTAAQEGGGTLPGAAATLGPFDAFGFQQPQQLPFAVPGGGHASSGGS